MNFRIARWLPRALAVLAAAASVSQAQSPAAGTAPAPANTPPPATTAAVPAAAAPTSVPEESSSYSVGLVFGNQLRGAGLEQSLTLEDVIRGLKEGLAGKALSPEDKDHAMQLVRSGRDALVARNHAAAKDYLAKNSASSGVITTASGMQYQVIDAGDVKAASPAPTDRVTVHYRGRLLDGTEFDSSDAHAQAATFSVNSVIKGWREALLMMKPGAKWRLFIPPELGYDLNSPPTIPPGSMLIFDVELLQVEPAAVMSPQSPKLPKVQKGAKPPVARSPAKPAAAGN
ncbi:MAG TPA: FKBP-type peptidyl-prolyl cis-trans isomerase [Steroidobacteraceae bacterium]|nr:FKBP-type peptidyl-prolyl cis-trans isomerase [Steroidobacteraceae bacterium]